MFFKALHIINICTILLSTIGVASYSHYCQEKLKSVSFFADLTVPCCKATQSCSSSKKIKGIGKKEVLACCSSRKKCKKKPEPQIIVKSFPKSCCSKPIEESKTPVVKKRNCCSDKSNFSQSDVETNLAQGSLDIGETVALLPKMVAIVFVFKSNYTTIYEDIAYQNLGYYPPPDIPLYIAHQSFLC